VRKILNMVTTSGKRWWLVAWDGRDELGRPWPDTWEPTAYVLKDLRDHWFAEGAARVERSIQVDVRPLDILVQRTIATAMIKDTIDTFGKVHCIDVVIRAEHLHRTPAVSRWSAWEVAAACAPYCSTGS
jgi:hypothetical protein